MDILKQTEKKMQSVIEHLKQELKTLRTGRANPAILDHVTVEVYGTHLRLQDLATVSVAEARMLMVVPFDMNNLHAISRAIQAANLNVQVITDANCIRLKIPEMDASVRQEMVKTGKKKAEEAKVGIRNARRDGNETAKKQKANGDIPEDILKKLEKQIQDLTDKYCKVADDVFADKEKEIMTI